MNEKLKNILKDYKDEMTEKLQEFIRIKSVTEENPEDCSEEAPFGEGPKKAMEFMIELGKSKGFRSVNYDNMVCELEFGDDKDDAVGTIGHVDVVPAGGNWTYHPYGGQIHEGRIYGRGAVDDKGPTIAAFYAALAIKESGLPLSRNIIQIIGTNEEGGSFPCLRHYLENAER
ncbi:MAG: M20/M25/M40 family metallo-hydrolase, partial [Lentihominibacter sp.]